MEVFIFSQGIIRTALPNMNRENREQYQVVIQAKDMGGQMGGLSGTTTVNITLTDVNDNPPRFPQSKHPLMVILPGKRFRVKKDRQRKKKKRKSNCHSFNLKHIENVIQK